MPAGFYSNQSWAHDSTNQLSADWDQLINCVEPGVLLLGWNENLQPHDPLWNISDIPVIERQDIPRSTSKTTNHDMWRVLPPANCQSLNGLLNYCSSGNSAVSSWFTFNHMDMWTSSGPQSWWYLNYLGVITWGLFCAKLKQILLEACDVQWMTQLDVTLYNHENFSYLKSAIVI